MNEYTHSRYVVGIDLGTTNCAVAYIDTAEVTADAQPLPTVLQIPQVIAPGQVEARPVLPSFLYLAAPKEFPEGALDLPWAPGRDFAVGEFAQRHGVQVPMRLVSSAKSWLCYPGVDRTGNILPFGADDSGEDAVGKLSPVDAAARYLIHLREAWDHQMAQQDPALSLAQQDVLLTVPASFDEVARELTVRAAQAAGLQRITLLEEPQAAFYAWLGRSGNAWREQLRVGDVVLVCDVGGGTTDFSLIAVTDHAGDLHLERIAVGDHILLGGDNMDLALGVSVLRRLEHKGHKLDSWQRRALVYSCRQAKELLMQDAERAKAPVVVLGRGSKVIGGSIKTELTRADAQELLLNGFFPAVPAADRPRLVRRSGLQEMGLPFSSEPAVTRHLAKFLGDHRQPTAVLFNGGVMKGTPLRGRVEEVLRSWNQGEGAPRALEGTDMDLAVALGAACYGMVRRGKGLRIRGGTARSYYIGVEASMPAVPGLEPPLRGLCVAPRGMEEGTAADVPGQELGLVVGEPVRFRFFSSTTRRGDRVGEVIEDVATENGVEELAPVEAVLPAGDGAQEGPAAGTAVPVRLHTEVSEVGVLALWCVARDRGRRWKLEYNIRERPQSAAGSPEAHDGLDGHDDGAEELGAGQ